MPKKEKEQKIGLEAVVSEWDVADAPKAEQAEIVWPDTSTAPDTGKLPPQQLDWAVDETGEPVPLTYAPLVIQQHAGMFDSEIAKILAYGESGTGKTRFASTFPDVIFADIDKGMSSVTIPVDRVQIDTFKQLEELHGFLYAGEHSYKTVVIDTLNEMQRLAMHATVEDFKMIRRAYDDLPSQSDYGKMLHDMIELTRKFIDLPMRVVLLAQVTTRSFDTDVLQPQLIGKNTSREICRKMDVIGYTYKAQEADRSHLAITFDAQEFVTKDRSFRLPTSLVDPSYTRMAAYWK